MSRRKKKKRTEISESWLLPYSDMLTLLLALFIILFAASEVDSQKYEKLAQVFRGEFSLGGAGILEEELPRKTPVNDNESDEKPIPKEHSDESEVPDEGTSDRPPLEQMKKSIDTYIEEHELEEKFQTALSEEGLKLTIVDDVFFDKGSSEVKEHAKQTAEEVAELLYFDPPHEVIVSGHTDDIPISNSSYASNWELSVARAVNFMKLMLENEKLDPTMFSAKGYGEYKPAVPNSTEENRQKNRRVEILITLNKK